MQGLMPPVLPCELHAGMHLVHPRNVLPRVQKLQGPHLTNSSAMAESVAKD